MKRTDIFKWAAQPPKYIESCEEMPYFWVSSVDERGFYDGLLDIVEILDDDWKEHRLKCRSMQDGSVTLLDEYIKEHEDNNRKLVWMQMQCPPMPDDTGVFQGCANEWYPYMEGERA